MWGYIATRARAASSSSARECLRKTYKTNGFRSRFLGSNLLTAGFGVSGIAGVATAAAALWSVCSESDFEVPEITEKVEEALMQVIDSEDGPRLGPPNELSRLLDKILDGCEQDWSGKLVCEIGCGPGSLALKLIDRVGGRGGYIGLDVLESCVAFVNLKIKLKGLSKNAVAGCDTDKSLCLPKSLIGKIDTFVACDTYQCLLYRRKVLEQAYKYLRPGGKLIIIDGKDYEDHAKRRADFAARTEAIKNMKGTFQGRLEPMPGFVGTTFDFTPSSVTQEAAKVGFKFDREVMKNELEQHFVQIYSK